MSKATLLAALAVVVPCLAFLPPRSAVARPDSGGLGNCTPIVSPENPRLYIEPTNVSASQVVVEMVLTPLRDATQKIWAKDQSGTEELEAYRMHKVVVTYDTMNPATPPAVKLFNEAGAATLMNFGSVQTPIIPSQTVQVLNPPEYDKQAVILITANGWMTMVNLERTVSP
jgi:hypothetical protein